MTLKADGFDSAIIGIEPNTQRVVYDRDMMIAILIQEDGMSYEDALEHLEYNVWGAFVGEYTPIYIQIATIDNIDESINNNNEY